MVWDGDKKEISNHLNREKNGERNRRFIMTIYCGSCGKYMGEREHLAQEGYLNSQNCCAEWICSDCNSHPYSPVDNSCQKNVAP